MPKMIAAMLPRSSSVSSFFETYHYNQIKGQRSLMTRGGINTILFVGEDEINLYSAMQNLGAFLNKAFFRWCDARGIDPDSIENNPRMLTYFPDPEQK